MSDNTLTLDFKTEDGIVLNKTIKVINIMLNCFRLSMRLMF